VDKRYDRQLSRGHELRRKRILVAWLLLTFGASPAALFGDEQPLASRILLVSKKLPSERSAITCDDYVKIKKSIKPRSENPPFEFYEPEIQGKTPSFVVFEKKNGVLSVCDNGKMTRGKFEPKVDDDHEIDLSKAVLKDLNNNGRTDFLAGYLNCAEGPCTGYWYLLEIEPNNLRINWRITATSVDVISSKNQNFLKISDTCFTHEFGTAFNWFFFAEFDMKGRPHPINSRELKQRLPDQVKDYVKATNMISLEATRDKIGNPVKAYADISKLIARAYDGGDSEAILKDFEKITKPFEKSGGLPVHCDISGILKNLVNNPKVKIKK
jgi:hypothetical protein